MSESATANTAPNPFPDLISGRITTTYTVWCKRCDRCGDDASPNLSGAQRVFRRAGWRRYYFIWFCPECAKLPDTLKVAAQARKPRANDAISHADPAGPNSQGAH